MNTVRIIIAILLIGLGVFFSIVSVFGVFRFKFVLNRMHAAAIGDTLALLLVLAGLIVISGLNMTSLKLAVIIAFFWIASPVSSHLISNMIATVDHEKVDKMKKIVANNDASEDNIKDHTNK